MRLDRFDQAPCPSEAAARVPVRLGTDGPRPRTQVEPRRRLTQNRNRETTRVVDAKAANVGGRLIGTDNPLKTGTSKPDDFARKGRSPCVWKGRG